MAQEILLPVSRMIGGSVYTPQLQFTENNQPVVDVRTGVQVADYNIGIAIPKQGEQSWAETEWGKFIKAIGDAAYPGQSLAPTFSWKITDGDSQIPNKNNNRPCDQIGYAGNWIIWMRQRWSPTICDLKSQPLTTPDAIMSGDWVQCYVSVAPNVPRPGKSHTPGIYINPMAVAFVGYHKDGRITGSAVNVQTIKFGSGAMPADVLATPVGNVEQPDVVQFVPPPAAPVPPPAPNTAFLEVPARVMTPAANGATYEQMIGAGWTDELLRQHGMML